MQRPEQPTAPHPPAAVIHLPPLSPRLPIWLLRLLIEQSALSPWPLSPNKKSLSFIYHISESKENINLLINHVSFAFYCYSLYTVF